MEIIVAFEEGFADDSIRKSRWKSFAKKKKITLDVSLQETIDFIKKFLSPLVDSIEENRPFDLKWNCEKKEWEWDITFLYDAIDLRMQKKVDFYQEFYKEGDYPCQQT